MIIKINCSQFLVASLSKFKRLKFPLKHLKFGPCFRRREHHTRLKSVLRRIKWDFPALITEGFSLLRSLLEKPHDPQDSQGGYEQGSVSQPPTHNEWETTVYEPKPSPNNWHLLWLRPLSLKFNFLSDYWRTQPANVLSSSSRIWFPVFLSRSPFSCYGPDTFTLNWNQWSCVCTFVLPRTMVSWFAFDSTCAEDRFS